MFKTFPFHLRTTLHLTQLGSEGKEKVFTFGALPNMRDGRHAPTHRCALWGSKTIWSDGGYCGRFHRLMGVIAVKQSGLLLVVPLLKFEL